MSVGRVLTGNDSDLTLSVSGFDDLSLTGETFTDDGRQFSIHALSDNTSWDEPQPIDTAVERWMTDGAVAQTQGHANRTLTFRVQVSAITSSDLAAGEAELALRAGGPALLSWTPPEGAPDAPPTVFEVWTWHLKHAFDGIDERLFQRSYDVTMTAKPWARSSAVNTSAAVTTGTGSPTTVEVDACTSVTGWTGDVSPTTSGGAVKETVASPGGFSSIFLTLTRTGSVTGLGTTPYLAIDMSVTGAVLHYFTVTADSTVLTLAAQIGSVTYWQTAPLTSFSTLKIQANVGSHIGGTMVFAVADISRTDTIGGIGSHKQLSRHLDVGGSVKTSGSIFVKSSSDTNPLGVVMLYTAPDNGTGYTPALRPYRISGPTVVPDAAAVSGNHDPFITSGTPVVPVTTYSIPAAALPPGSYLVVGRWFSNTATSMTANAVGGVTGYTGIQTVSSKVSWATANTWSWGVLGVLSLPAQALPTESTLPTTVVVGGSVTSGTPTITLDEIYLLDLTRGAVTLADCGGSTRMWLDAADADPDRGLPGIFVGSQDDRSDAAGLQFSSIMSFGDHDLAPGGVTLFTVTDKVNDAVVSASFYHRWHTHAGD